MKVGTDGVLLGCWVRPNPDPARFDCPPDTLRLKGREFRILDIGTGSGLIARMLMQRCPEAIVDAIDIDEAAVEQAARAKADIERALERLGLDGQ